MRFRVLSFSSASTARRCVVVLLAACLPAAPLAANAAETTLTVLHDFLGDGSRNGGGAVPLAGVVQAPDGRFYGTASLGGAAGQGTVYVSRADGRTVTLHSFDGSDGATPAAPLVLGRDGVYGSASSGGDCSFCGTLFKIDRQGKFSVLRQLRYGREGAQPNGLILASDGNFYGTTFFGGAAGSGTLFRLTPAGQVTVLYNFSPTDAANPSGPLLEGADGSLYGTSLSGGTGSSGAVFKYAPDGSLTLVHSFTAAGLIGYAPSTGVIQASDGTLYGLTSSGGIGNAGTMFKVKTDGTGFQKLFGFPFGERPLSGLTLARDGFFYGTTFGGGEFGSGAVFRISTTGNYTVLNSFTSDGANGVSPASSLWQVDDGSMYGTASAGGSSGEGTLFRVSPAAGH